MTESRQEWHSVATLTEIPLRGSRRIVQGENKIALFRTAEDKVYALKDSCPHAGGPLSAGIVHDGCVTCPLHNWVISLESGQAQGADSGSTPTYPVRVVNDQVELKLELAAEVSA